MASCHPIAWCLTLVLLVVALRRVGLVHRIRLHLRDLLMAACQMYLIRLRLTVALPPVGLTRLHLTVAVRPACRSALASSYVLRHLAPTTDITTAQCRRCRVVVHSCLGTEHLRRVSRTEIDHRWVEAVHSYLDTDTEHRPAMVPRQAWANGLRAIQLPWGQAICRHSLPGRMAAGTECRLVAILAILPLPMAPDRLAGRCHQAQFRQATMLEATAAVLAQRRQCHTRAPAVHLRVLPVTPFQPIWRGYQHLPRRLHRVLRSLLLKRKYHFFSLAESENMLHRQKERSDQVRSDQVPTPSGIVLTSLMLDSSPSVSFSPRAPMRRRPERHPGKVGACTGSEMKLPALPV